MATFYQQEPNFKEIAKRENNFNYSVASLGDIYSPYLTTKQQRQYDILTEEEMLARGIRGGRPNFSYKKYNKPKYPQDPNLKNVNINQVDLGKGMSQNIYLNQGKAPGQLKGRKIKSQRPSSAISTKKIKYNQDLDPAQRNRIIDVNYLHLTKLPESKKFSHVDKAYINPVQSTFSVKNIVDDNIKKHEKMMKPIVLYPDPVRIFNEQPQKILPGTLRRTQEEIKEYELQNNSRKNMMVIGQGKNTSKTYRDNHVTFNKPKENRFKRKATSTKAARNTLLESEDFVKALEDYFTSTDYRVPAKNSINDILRLKAEKLENSLNKYESEISGKKKMNTDTSKYLYQDPFKNKKRNRLGKKIIKPRGPKVYPEIEYEFRKKIQERLSRLQINLRQIFDNISILKKNKTKENVKKIKEQIEKARELTNYVRHLADDVNKGEEDFKNSFQRPKSNSPKRKKHNVNQNFNLNNSFTNTSFNSINTLPQNNLGYYRTMNNPSNQINNNNYMSNTMNNTMNNSMMSNSTNNLYNNQLNNNATFPNNQNNINNTINNNMNNTINNSINNNINNTMNNNFNNTNNNNNNFNNMNNTNNGYPNQNNNYPPPTTQTQLNPNQNQQLENPLEYSSTSISSNINPMNSFSSNVNNISLVQQNNQNNNNLNIINNNITQNNNQNINNMQYNQIPQSQNQNQFSNNMMSSRANIYMQSQNINPIIEDPNEEANNNASTINSRLINSNQSLKSNIPNNNNMPNSNINKNTNINKSNINNNIQNTQNQPYQNTNTKIKNSTQNSNYFLQSTNNFKDLNQKSSKNIKPKVTFNTKSNKKTTSNPLLSNSLANSKMITVSLDEPYYFKNKPKTSQTFRGTTSISLINPKSSDVLTQSHVINDMDQTINHVPMQAEEMNVNTHNYIEDERYSAFNVEFPVNYYYQLTKEHEPPKNKEWFIRPHHTETFVESNNAIPDDIMNTKYISYYAPATTEKKKTRQDILEELIMETRAHINDLQEDMFKKANLTSDGEKLYNKLEGLKEEAKNSFIPGYRDAKEAKQKNVFDMLKDPNSGASYTEMFDQNDDIKQTNFAISSVGTMLSELRDKERNIINTKRKEEYERIRPPIDRWYELRGDNFLNEIIRNKMVLNSGPEYFEKIEELQNEELY